MPKCHISTCDVVDSVHLWTCTGPCHRRFHAACVGVQRNCEESIRRFMLPVCRDCQNLMSEQIDQTKLMAQQTEILEQLKIQNISHEKLSSQVAKFSCLETLIDGIDTISNQINGQKIELSALIKAALRPPPSAEDLLDTLSSSMKEQYVSAFDGHKTKIAQTFEMLEEMILGHQNSLMNMVEEQHRNCFTNLEQELTPSLQSIAVELNALRATVHNPSANADLIDELRSIHDAVSAKPVLSPPAPVTSLAEELNPKVVSGWRLLGTRRVWKADWSAYDARQMRRKEQQKNADKAKKKKNRQRKARNRNAGLNQRDYPNNKLKSRSPPSTDKELLAAAKVTFNRKPQPKKKIPTFINFQRGETLNPGSSSVPSNTPPLDPGPSLVAPNTPPHHDRLPARFPTTSAATTSPYQANMCTHHASTSMPPYTTFNPVPTSFSAPFAGPCCHHGPNAFDFNNPVMYPYFLPHRRVPL